MNIAILSDTHDNTPAIVWIIEYLNQHNIEVAFHAGDIINPGIIRRWMEHYQGHLHFVFGNNDGDGARLVHVSSNSKNLTCHFEIMQQEIFNKKIFMNHYSEIGELVAKSQQFDVVIGGHDHQYRVIHHGNSLFINPGSTVTGDKWLRNSLEEQSSFVILNLATMEHERVMVPTNF